MFLPCAPPKKKTLEFLVIWPRSPGIRWFFNVPALCTTEEKNPGIPGDLAPFTKDSMVFLMFLPCAPPKKKPWNPWRSGPVRQGFDGFFNVPALYTTEEKNPGILGDLAPFARDSMDF